MKGASVEAEEEAPPTGFTCDQPPLPFFNANIIKPEEAAILAETERTSADFWQGTSLRSWSLEEFLRMEFPPRAMLLGPWLPEKGLAMLYSPRGVGKTHLALGCAYAVASGGSFLGWQAETARRVLVIDGEMPGITLQERLNALVANSEFAPPEGYFRVLPYDLLESGGPDLSTEEGQAELEPYIGDAALIIVDNISTICRGGKENEAESWAAIQQWALGQRRKGRTVLFVHHSGKSGDQRGTSKREDVMDTVIKLSRPSDYSPTEGARFTVEFMKSRGFAGPDAESFEAAMSDGRWTTNAAREERTARIMELHDEGMTQREIARVIGCSAPTVNRAIKGAKAS